MLLIAHAGHWLVTIAYFIPVIGFMVWLAVTQLKEKRKQRQK
jgi:preprotein translocase subunit YajC